MKEFSQQVEDEIPPVPGSREAAKDGERRSRSDYRHPMIALKTAHAADRTITEQFADTLIRVASSSPFLFIHVGWFIIWIPWNTGLLGLHVFDPYPFGLLTMVVSLEAIFLSIFVLIGQNREASIAELREELTLQVNLRMEAEVTKTLQLVAGLYTRAGYQMAVDPELQEMLRALDKEGMERELIQQIKGLIKK